MKFVFCSHHECLEEFKSKRIKSNWDSLILVADGAYSMLVGEEGKRITVRKNEIALIPAHIEFFREVKTPVTYYNICFTEKETLPFYTALSTGILKIPQERVETILDSISLASMLPEKQELLVHLTEHILVENYLFGDKDKEKHRRLCEETQKAIRYMRRNLDKKINIEELARHVFLSHSGLLWKFKQDLNMTPTKYLYLLRMERAKQLLLGFPYSITEISEMCGYQNPYYFTNEFRRYYKTNPSEFRKQYIKISHE